MSNKIKIACMSDTHCLHHNVAIPECDVLIHSGDMSNHWNPYINHGEVLDFLKWYDQVNVKHKILIAGNHDTSIAKKLIDFKDYPTINYLENELIELNVYGRKLNVYGSPITPTFGNKWSFNCARHKIHKYWDNIPNNTDILVTHGPPKGILDHSVNISGNIEQCGCNNLLKKIIDIKPLMHVFGHLHDEKDIYNHGVYERDNTKFVNASIVDIKHRAVNEPIIVTL